MWDWLTGLFTGEDTILPNLIEAGATIYSNKLVADANERAADTYADASRQSTQAYTSAINQRTDAIREGNERAQARYDEQQQQTLPAVQYLQNVVAQDPYQLTPLQKVDQDRLRRDTRNTLAASNLRGAGRATTQAIRGVESDWYGRAVASNQRRSDTAANQLGREYFNAGDDAARIDVKTGLAVGLGYEDIGRNQASSYLDVASEQANADLATAGTNVGTVGTIASVFANDAKEKARDRKYDDIKLTNA